ncbi:MAG: SGNH/GDSL hydrolase family protein [Candidatus Caenarcaniphilales bacterium]|nr:SGNH/GDSL hydrolase family protein [Candidatus Caenarcaniphilales bacterium]
MQINPKEGKFYVILLSVLFLTSLSFNFLALKYLVYAYNKFSITRLDPLGRQFKDKFNFEDKSYKFVILGDSIAYNWKLDDSLNLGIPSQTSEQIRIRSDYYRDKLHGSTLIIFAGGNDVKSLALSYEERKWSEKFKKNLEKIIENHQANFDKILVATITPVYDVPFVYKPFYGQKVKNTRKLFNETLLKLVADIKEAKPKNNKIQILNTEEILTKGKCKKDCSVDGIHLSKKGYKLLEEELNLLNYTNQ